MYFNFFCSQDFEEDEVVIEEEDVVEEVEEGEVETGTVLRKYFSFL